MTQTKTWLTRIIAGTALAAATVTVTAGVVSAHDLAADCDGVTVNYSPLTGPGGSPVIADTGFTSWEDLGTTTVTGYQNNGTEGPKTASRPPACESPGKVTICHYPPGNPDNPQTIEIAESAWEAHQAKHARDGGHDTEGPCPQVTTTTTTEPEGDDGTTTTTVADTTTTVADTTTTAPADTTTTVVDGTTTTVADATTTTTEAAATTTTVAPTDTVPEPPTAAPPTGATVTVYVCADFRGNWELAAEWVVFYQSVGRPDLAAALDGCDNRTVGGSLPSTGGYATGWTSLIALVALIAGSVLLVVRRRA
jgi:LPXTG-motif cell wall-anchored protein